jgi:hypothetical protein
VDETCGIPFASLADFPPVLHPEGLRFLGVLLGWLAHSPHHTTSDPRKQEMRTSRNTAILNPQASVLRVVGPAFNTAVGVVMMPWVRAKNRSSRPARD